MTETAQEARYGRSAFDWDDLRLFAAVAEHGSYQKAGKVLGLSPSTLSKRIDELEFRLEAKLFARLPGNRLLLTDAGSAILDPILTMQRSAEVIQSRVKESDRRNEGRVTVAVPDGLAAYAIGPFLSEFADAHPKIELALDVGYWSRNPVAEQPDVRIEIDNTTAKLDEVWVPLGFMHYLLFASPKYVEKFGLPATLAQAADHRAIEHVAQAFQPEAWGKRPTALKLLSIPNLVTNSSGALHQAVRGGLGIAAIPTYILNHSPELIIVRDDWHIRIQMWLVYHRDAPKTARIQSTLDWLRALFEPKANPWYRDEFVHPREWTPCQW